jgi:hypothetical protein
MSDVCDVASDYEEVERQSRILAARSYKAITPTGYCLFCGEEMPGDRRFCDRECADEYEYRQKLVGRK